MNRYYAPELRSVAMRLQRAAKPVRREAASTDHAGEKASLLQQARLIEDLAAHLEERTVIEL